MESEYERKRAKNIARNEAMLRELGLPTADAEVAYYREYHEFTAR